MTRKIRLIAMLLVISVILLAGMAQAEAKIQKIGVLSLLNMSEQGYAQIEKTRVAAAALLDEDAPGAELSQEGLIADEPEIIYFDHLNDLILALNAGTIQAADLPMEVASYAAARNEGLRVISIVAPEEDVDNLDEMRDFLWNSVFCCDFSFMATEENKDLLAEINQAAAGIYDDGTEAQLYETYVLGAIEGDPEVEEIEKVDSWDTIRVLVTGDMPPIDYMTADGKPAGFNVAMLKEIGKRLQKNIELISADAGSRGLMLANGLADVAFWTRSNVGIVLMNEQGLTTQDWRQLFSLSEEDSAVTEKIDKLAPNFDAEGYARMDIPEGLTTGNEYYFSTVSTLLVNESVLK